jgi:signal transduction histidine kinase
MLARARRVITAWVTAVAAVVLLLVGGVIYLVTLAGQSSDIDRDLRYAAQQENVTGPPACVWLAVTRHATTGTSPGTSPGIPAGFPLTGTMRAVAAGHPDVEQDVSANGTRYRVLTTHRGGDVVQAVRDLRYEQQDRQRLMLAIVVAEAIGLASAAVVGVLLARKATAPLGEALSRQRRFVADASHELRTPLTRLHTRAQLLVRLTGTIGLPEKVTADLRQLVDNSRQLGDVIDDLLLSARMASAPGRTIEVDLAALVDEICRDEQIRAAPAALTLTARTEGGPYLVAGVPSALRRALSALVDNAIAHTPPGGAITVTAEAPGDGTVLLTVRDTGTGFAPGQADRLFERFARGDSGRGRRFGIGLSLVREVVHSHGGWISAEGEPGSGARFTVGLPVLVPGLRRPRVPRPRPSAVVRRSAAAGRKSTGRRPTPR